MRTRIPLRSRLVLAAVLLAAAVPLSGLRWFGADGREAPATTFSGDWPVDSVQVETCRWLDERLVCRITAGQEQAVPAHSIAVKVLGEDGVRVFARSLPEVPLRGGETAELVVYAGEAAFLEPGRLTLRFEPMREAYWKAREMKGDVEKNVRDLMDALEGLSEKSLKDLLEAPPDNP